MNRNSTNNIDIVSDFIFDENSKILCVGASANETVTNFDMMLIRFNENGSIDLSFNETGYDLIDFNNSNDFGISVLFQNDGKLLVSGAIQTINTNVYSGTLARFTYENLSTSQFSKSNFSVAPNPFSDKINLSFASNENKVLDIDLYDINGRKIQNLVSQKQFYSGENQFKLDLPETLSKGIYFLTINDGKQSQSIKIIK